MIFSILLHFPNFNLYFRRTLSSNIFRKFQKQVTSELFISDCLQHKGRVHQTSDNYLPHLICIHIWETCLRITREMSLNIWWDVMAAKHTFTMCIFVSEIAQEQVSSWTIKSGKYRSREKRRRMKYGFVRLLHSLCNFMIFFIVFMFFVYVLDKFSGNILYISVSGIHQYRLRRRYNVLWLKKWNGFRIIYLLIQKKFSS